MNNQTVIGIILAGGNAKRLDGINKGNIVLSNNKTIINNLIAEFHKANINDIIISANESGPYLLYKLPVINDLNKNYGPIAGIEGCLNYVKYNYTTAIFIPCDLPNITHQEISVLKKAANDTVIYAKTNSGFHPLCVAMPINKIAALTKLLPTQGKIRFIWDKLDAKVIEFNEENKFYNINSWQDLKNINRTTIWTISGSGRKVGKTTLANKLLHKLPNSTYVKYGHGIYKPHKHKNFYTELTDVYQFIEKNILLNQHIIIEANAKPLLSIADIKIFINGTKNNSDFRDDVEFLTQQANIIMSN